MYVYMYIQMHVHFQVESCEAPLGSLDRRLVEARSAAKARPEPVLSQLPQASPAFMHVYIYYMLTPPSQDAPFGGSWGGGGRQEITKTLQCSKNSKGSEDQLHKTLQ